jgi:PBP1b-binding outer membrane lipoprotein LpoB
MKQCFVFLLFAFFLFACANPSNTSNTAKPEPMPDSSANKNFLPVVDMIAGELKMIDSLQLPITKTVIVGKQSQIFPLTPQELQQLANEFLQPDINNSRIKKFYKETSVADQSSGAINFMYTSTVDSLEIRRLDVTLKGDPVLNDKLNNVYIEKYSKSADTAVTKKLFWKAGKNFQIITEKRWGNQVSPRQTIKVVWDPTE